MNFSSLVISPSLITAVSSTSSSLFSLVPNLPSALKTSGLLLTHSIVNPSYSLDVGKAISSTTFSLNNFWRVATVLFTLSWSESVGASVSLIESKIGTTLPNPV